MYNFVNRVFFNPSRRYDHMRLALKLTLTVAAMALLVVPSAWADVPTNMNVQGRLADSTGAPQSPGAYGFTFRLFDAELGGTQIWPSNGSSGEAQIIVLGTDGLWTAALGTDSALGEAVFQDTTRWLEVTVDNFSDPIETLPRTKLNTSPYTFRAATVQTVDGAAGGTLTGGLEVLGGSIRNLSLNANNGADEGNLVINNSAGPSLGPWNTGNGAWGGTFNTNSNAGFNVALAASTGGDVGSHETFVALATGGPSTNSMTVGRFESRGTVTGSVIGVSSSIGSTGGTRISGSFSGGDFIVQSPQSTGSAAVVLPNDAISDFEIEDEPGLANSVRSFVTAGAPGAFVADSVEINCPTDGYVIVTGSIGWVNVTHTTGTTTELQLSINKTPGVGLPDGVAVWRLHSPHPSTGLRAVPLHTTRVYSETAGTQKYYLMYNYQSGSGAASGNRISLRALFVPTLYGDVTLTESVEGGEQPGADVRTDGSVPLPELRTKTITVPDHKAAIDAELADLRARLEALESEMTPVTTASTSEER
jgi:hypothetical protein